MSFAGQKQHISINHPTTPLGGQYQRIVSEGKKSKPSKYINDNT